MSTDTERFAREVGVDISTDNATWLNLPARTDNNSSFAPNKVDATNVDTDGFMKRVITLQDGTIVVKYNSLINAGTPNPAHNLVEACEGQFGDSTLLYVRVYDTDGGARGWTGLAMCEVTFSKTAVPDLREVTATFTWQGAPTKMTPSNITAAIASTDLPVVLSALPSGVAAGGLVTITGSRFTASALASVKFAAVTVTSYSLVSDSKIVAVMPAGSAGSAAVTVTNVAGVSNALPYTRGA